MAHDVHKQGQWLRIVVAVPAPRCALHKQLVHGTSIAYIVEEYIRVLHAQFVNGARSSFVAYSTHERTVLAHGYETVPSPHRLCHSWFSILQFYFNPLLFYNTHTCSVGCYLNQWTQARTPRNQVVAIQIADSELAGLNICSSRTEEFVGASAEVVCPDFQTFSLQLGWVCA